MLWSHRCLKQYYEEGRILEDWKIKISVLWLFYDVAFLVDMVLGFMEPGAIEQIMAGEIGGTQIGPEFLLLFAVILLAPLVMAFLSLTLKGSINRWANIILSIVFTSLMVIALIELLAQPTAYSILLTLSKVVAGALIVWYAWKSKQKT